MTGSKQRYLFIFVVAGFLGLAAWLVFGLDPPMPKAPEIGSLGVSRADGGNASARNGKPQPRDAGGVVENGNTPQGPVNDTPPDDTGPRDVHLPDPADSTWDPASYRNESIVWRLPRALPDAARPQPADDYNGSPVFMYGRQHKFLHSRSVGHATTFDPARPDGTLIINVTASVGGFSSLADATASVGKIEAVSHDGANVYVIPHSMPRKTFAVPYSFQRGEMIGLTITGERMLPAEAVISQQGGFKVRRGMREMILLLGYVELFCHVFPSDHVDFRTIQVTDDTGHAVTDAMLTFDGIQILGRSDSSGLLRFPWLSGRKVPGEFFFLSAPGYVPMLLEHAELDKAVGPVQITLHAHELLVSVHQTVPDPQVLKLGVIVKAQSEILKNGADLIPIPDDYSLDSWADVDIILRHRGDPERVERMRAVGRPPDLSALGPVDYRGGAISVGIFEPGHKFGDFGARKLGEVLGRTPSENWPQYAHWYCGRWDYDEREGRFDVALPYAGRFLLLVGEYNRGVYPDQRNGKVTHALYIDARDLSDIRSKLIIHPLG
jgi:hypothetical protein